MVQAIPQNNNAPPPPPPFLPPGGLKNWNPPKNNTTGEKPSVGITQENTPPLKKFTPPKDHKQVPASLDDITQGRAKLKKSVQPNNSIGGQQGPVKESDAVESNQGTDKNETLTARIERKQLTVGNIQNHPHDVASILARRAAMEFLDSESDDEDDDRDRTHDSEWEDEYSTPLNPQLGSNKKRDSSDSDYGSDNDVKSEPTPPSHSVPKVKKPPVLPKPSSFTKEANSSSPEPQAPSATTVTNKAGKLPASSIKERCGMFGGMAIGHQRSAVPRINVDVKC